MELSSQVFHLIHQGFCIEWLTIKSIAHYAKSFPWVLSSLYLAWPIITPLDVQHFLFLLSFLSFLTSFLPPALMVIKESVPPRPPLPKTYYPLEPSSTFPPSIPPLPLDSTALLWSLGIDDGYHDGEDFRTRQVFGCFRPCPTLLTPSPNCCPLSSFKNIIFSLLSVLSPNSTFSFSFQTSICSPSVAFDHLSLSLY